MTRPPRIGVLPAGGDEMLVASLAMGLARAGFVDAVEVVAGDHSVGPPFGNVVPRQAVRPVVGVGAEHRFGEGRALALAQSLRVSGHYGPNAGSGWRVATELTGRLTTGIGPLFEGSLALGAIHNWWRDGLRFDSVTRRYVAAADPGRVGVTLGFGVGTGFDLERVTDLPLALTLTYRWFLQTAWLPVTPGPKGEVTVGVRWHLTRSGGAS